MKSAKEYWKERFGEYPKSHADKLAVAMMAEYYNETTNDLKNNIANAPVISSVCGLNRDPDECSVNLYTEKGCKTCYYSKQTDL